MTDYPFKKPLIVTITALVGLVLSLIVYQFVVWIALGVLWPVILVSCVLIGIASWGAVWLKENNPNKEILDLKQQVSNLTDKLYDERSENQKLKFLQSPFSKIQLNENDPRYSEYFGPR
jgi:hypothetical protein